jgi:ubiquinone/menaquinone biosynthesis C-methylase UbiE
MVDQKVQTNQTKENRFYAGTKELFDNENSLKKYNQSLVLTMVESLKHKKQVIEFGAGIGTLALLWYQQTGKKPTCIEIDPNQKAIIEQRGFICLESIEEIPINGFDGVYTSNVLEHVENDQEVLRSIYERIEKKGTIFVYVPAFMFLYSHFDQQIGHYRRYSKKELIHKLETAGFTVSKCYYNDSIGWFLWLLNKLIASKTQSQSSTQNKLLSIYDRYIYPLSHFLDNIGFKYLFGKNLLLIAHKD